MSAQLKTKLTAEEYLAIERKAERKSEFYDGEMFLMAGATREHNLIVTNVVRELSNQLKGKPCETYPSDMRVRVPATETYTYPDVVVVCDEPQFDDKEFDTLLNPTLIIEVLSRSTASYDKGGKFAHYRTIESLKEYVVVAQNRYEIEHHAKQADGRWVLTDVRGLERKVELESINCALDLREVYERVELSQAERG